jgi:hypothetical protein
LEGAGSGNPKQRTYSQGTGCQERPVVCLTS